MGRLIGIDLGTTFSAAAYVNEHGKPEIIPNSESERITPSVILFERDATVVGKIAKNLAVSNSADVADLVKREMGSSVEDYYWKFHGTTYSADELSAVILKKIKQDAEASLGEAVTDAVITVPAYFTETQRAATSNAGKIAGLNVRQLLNEPTAAAIAYGLNKLGSRQRVFVFDLGGGTFDVTLMEVDGSTIQMIQTNGDNKLGGADWDKELVTHVAEKFLAEHGSDPLSDGKAYQDLQLRATLAKEELSRRTHTTIVCGYAGNTTEVRLTREDFEVLTRDLVKKCQTLCKVVLHDAKMTWAHVDTVLLVGGSTRMPMIQDLLRRLTGKEINPREVNPDEVVALGAALYGAIAQIRDEPESSAAVSRAFSERYGSDPVKIFDGATHPLGAIVVSGPGRVLTNHVMIPKMERVPCSKTEDFFTLENNQRRLELPVVQCLPDGQKEDSDVKFEDFQIGKLVLDLPAGLPARSPISVTYEYTADQTLEVSAVGPEGRKAKTTINRATLNQDQVDRATVALSRMTVE